MTSPLTAIRHFYFSCRLGMEPKKLDLVECFFGDDIALHFNFTDENATPIAVSSATATFKVADKDAPATMIFEADDSGQSLDLSGTEAIAYINTEDDLLVGGGFKYQLRLTLAGKSVVAAFGDIENMALIE